MIKKKSIKRTIILIVTLCFLAIENGLTQATVISDKNEVVLKNYLRDKLTNNNDIKHFDTISFDIWINPFLVKENGIGIYNFGRVVSHSSKKNFFIYDGKKIIILDDRKSLLDDIESFLINNDFSNQEIRKCKSDTRDILDEKDTSSW